MVFLLICALSFYLIAGHFGISNIFRFTVLGFLYGVVLLSHLVLPDAHPFRVATGYTIAPWAIAGGFVAMIFLYRFGLKQLSVRAKEKEISEDVASSDVMRTSERERYSRHIVLREIGGPGQMALKRAKVLVIGAGGLGAPALQYLAASGIGTIGVIDNDVVENANLQRQIIHQDKTIGIPKVFSAQSAMLAQNPYINVKPYYRRLSEDIAKKLFSEFDLILEGSDNFETRYLANRTAHELGMPLVSGSLSQWEGQISVFDTAKGSPCYECVFPPSPAVGLAPTCAQAGVFAPLPGVIGTMMASEALKIITSSGEVLRNELFIYDSLFGESRKIGLSKRHDCSVCGAIE